MRTLPKRLLPLSVLLGLASAAPAAVLPSPLFSDHMVLQRDQPVPVFGTAAAGEKVAVSFGGKTVSTTADPQGDWQVLLPALAANPQGQTMTISGSNSIAFDDVLVGDVWLCSGQSNMDMSLGGCDRKEDVESADFPGIRSFRVPHAAAEVPLKTPKGDSKWVVCNPSSAGGFSAAAFYFARKIQQETRAAIPIGLVVASVGGTSIDLWLAPEGLTDIPVLHPLLGQPALPSGPFHLSNGMIAPLAPYGIKGAIWYQGENAEKSVQSKDSYFLKMKALVQGWKRLWAMDDFPFYFVMIANWGEQPKDAKPVFSAGGWDADTRLQQANAMALPHAGCASALDIGDSSMGDKTWDGWHPKGKLDVGERLALWALRNDYGRPDTVACGPVLRNATVTGNSVVCSFDHTEGGLMVGAKQWYQPTKEIPGGSLTRFVIAGEDGKWFPADAVIKGDTVVMSSPSVPDPRKISYACWQNPEGCNLYNKAGLPAAPFHVEDLTVRHSITTKAGEGGEISPPGTSRFLPRRAVLYTIKPKPGFFVADVKVDGKSVGSVTRHTFDPLDADHMIEASFVRKAPVHMLTVSANGGGTITPSGKVAVPQGGAVTLNVAPKPGIVVKSLVVDGAAISPRESITFSHVRANHTVEATFACRISVEAGFGGTVTPPGDVLAGFGETLDFKLTPIAGHSIASVKVDGKEMGALDHYSFRDVNASHSLAVKFKANSPKTGKVPRPDQLILACLADSLPAAGTTAPWPAMVPRDAKLNPIATPVTREIDGLSYSFNASNEGDGFRFKTCNEPIKCAGASIVTVARPVRNGAGSGWVSIVDVFYDRLVLGIRNDDGRVCVRRNGPVATSDTAIPDGQITILSLVVQPDGRYKVHANGTELMSSNGTSDMTSLVPGQPEFARAITLGRNAPDAWTTFNGDIGDTLLYQVALTDGERGELEAYLEQKLSGKR